MRAGDFADLFGRVDTVQEGQNRRLRAENRQDGRGGGGEIVGLDGKKD